MGVHVPNSLMDLVKGIYSGLENKWYAALDALDQKFHIYPIIDRIDEVIPSFLVFLSALFLIFILVIIKFNKHGALVSIKQGVAGLCHQSTMGGEDKIREKLSLGKNYNFQVTLFEPKNQRMTLVLLEDGVPAKTE